MFTWRSGRWRGIAAGLLAAVLVVGTSAHSGHDAGPCGGPEPDCLACSVLHGGILLPPASPPVLPDLLAEPFREAHRAAGVRLVIGETFYPSDRLEFVARGLGAAPLILPIMTGGCRCATYIELIEHLVGRIVEGLGGGSGR
ncbi:MAG: hypothetical protein QME96_00325 [Myxococcota bacterium]|nr:hypothetical protein [Myxococcota bacterium]